jgi:hypothetical protein
MTAQTTRRWLIAALTLALLAAACAPAADRPAASALSEAEATAIADNALAGLNAGDYAAWSRDWGAAMKAAIPEQAFLAFREDVLATYGQFVSIESAALKPAQQAGNVRWEFTTHFERGDLLFAFAFAETGEEIVGLHPTPIE